MNDLERVNLEVEMIRKDEKPVDPGDTPVGVWKCPGESTMTKAVVAKIIRLHGID